MIVYQDFNYPLKNENRRLHIYLPPFYDRSNERYPVMYMFDGQNLFHDAEATYGKSWGLEYFLDHYDKNMIVCGMECGHNGDERLSEYNPYDMSWHGHFVHGAGEETFRWLIEEVKPFMDSHFRTYGHREATGIGGSSMGGIMSMYGAVAHNDVFSKAACLSTGVFWNLSRFRKTLSMNVLSPDTRIYISWGEKEAGRAAHNGNPETDTREARAVYRFEHELQEKGARTYHLFVRGGEHNEASWERQNQKYMDFLWMNRD
ncbi:MAG: alpha/beta hydrolase-fold protein [Bulleidia sp.]|nr:alpha/beta hydrolase-fold protein [Bulleidia sp.]